MVMDFNAPTKLSMTLNAVHAGSKKRIASRLESCTIALEAKNCQPFKNFNS